MENGTCLTCLKWGSWARRFAYFRSRFVIGDAKDEQSRWIHSWRRFNSPTTKLRQPDLPVAVYKYLTADRATTVVDKLLIRFSQASVLNDATELKLRLRDSGHQSK
jgi:hypothetical protein